MDRVEKTCEICEILKNAKNDNYFVMATETGSVFIGWHQYFKGYTLFICNQHKTELHFLDNKFKLKFLKEMSMVAEAVYKAFKPEKLNYDLLGNGSPHMHWHLIPRYKEDLIRKEDVYTHKPDAFKNDKYLAAKEEIDRLKSKLIIELEQLFCGD